MYMELKGLTKTVGIIAAASAAVVGIYVSQPAAPVMHSTTFAFDASPSPEVVGYKVYFGGATNTLTNSQVIGSNLVFTLQTTYKDVHAQVVAFDTNGVESIPSNPAGIYRRGTTDKVIAQISTNLTQWQDAFFVTEISNIYQQQFYKLRIERTNNTTVYP